MKTLTGLAKYNEERRRERELADLRAVMPSPGVGSLIADKEADLRRFRDTGELMEEGGDC